MNRRLLGVLVGAQLSPQFLQCPHSLGLRVVQLLSRIQLFATPCTAAHQASLSFTTSQSLPKFMSVELVIPSNHHILCSPCFSSPTFSHRASLLSKASHHVVSTPTWRGAGASSQQPHKRAWQWVLQPPSSQVTVGLADTNYSLMRNPQPAPAD